jgi:hypothetical protein
LDPTTLVGKYLVYMEGDDVLFIVDALWAEDVFDSEHVGWPDGVL